MSANIYWRTVKKGKDLNIATPQNFMEMFKGAFSIPAVLMEDDIDMLNGMRIGSENYKEPLAEIIEAIKKHGEVEIYAEY